MAADQAPLSLGFSRQEHWNGLPFNFMVAVTIHSGFGVQENKICHCLHFFPHLFAKNTLEGINSRISEAEERISELEDKMVEITSEEQNKVKRIKRTEDNLRDLWDKVKHPNISIIGVPEEEKKKGYEKILKRL